MPSPTLLIFFTVFIDLIGFGIVLPLLPSYAASFQVGPTAIGMLVASFSLMQFLLAQWWGRLSDRIGRRPVLLIGLLGSALSYLLFGLAGSFAVLLVSRLVAGGMGATVNVAQAYLADITPLEQRPRAMGMIGAAFGLGFVVGPALGGISSHWGNAAPGLLASGLTAVNLLLTWRWLPESRPTVHRPENSIPVHWSRFTLAFGAVAFSTIAFTVMYVIFPLELQQALGYNRDQAAHLFVLIGVVSAAVQGGLIGRLVPRFGERALMAAGGFLLAGGLVALAEALGPLKGAGGGALLYGSLLVLAFGSAMIGPSAASYVSRLAPSDEQGRALGLMQSVAAMARIGGPILAGAVANHFGATMAFLVAGGSAGAAGLSALFSAGGRTTGSSGSP
jgi:MFS transporter, DHA1 family, tetracycline resistance protein